ncbi:MAG: response regulator [Hyphomonadaceae bacterium]
MSIQESQFQAGRLDRAVTLIVDDHFFMRSIMKTILVSLGAPQCIEASDAVQAFEILSNNPCDLVITDYHLGGLNGAELTKLLRCAGDTAHAHVPIIGCTADSRRRIVKEFVDAGVDELLVKPISPVQVWSRLHNIITARRPFVQAPTYFGPERRRKANPTYSGPERRRQPAAMAQ